jgi:hypothetical protein
VARLFGRRRNELDDRRAAVGRVRAEGDSADRLPITLDDHPLCIRAGRTDAGDERGQP